MHPLHALLLVTDLSDTARPALQRALQLASAHRARLTVLAPAHLGHRPFWGGSPRTPFDSHPSVQRTRRTLSRLSREVGGPCELRALGSSSDGDTLAEIARAADPCDLVLLGVDRANPLRALVLGTPAERLVRVSRRPVLVVKQAPAFPWSAYRRVLLPLDPDSGSAAQAAVGLAARLAPRASLHLLHALWVPMASRLRMADCSSELLARTRQRERDTRLHRLWSLAAALPGNRAFADVEEGPPGALALRKAQACVADLVVVGKEGRSTLGDFLLGSTARHLLIRAQADVLVIPKAALARLAGPQTAHGWSLERA